MSSSISFIDSQKMQTTDKNKMKASLDLWYPLNKYADDCYNNQNPESKSNQTKRLRTMTSLNSDLSNFSSLTGISSMSNIIWKNKRGEINRVNT
jgi:hypothetical protein